MPTVFVTGASSGFGKAIAARFLAKGWNVLATMRNPKPDLYAPHERLRLLALDVTDAASIERAVAEGLAAFGGIDALVNNAGIGAMSALEHTPDAIVREIYETNLFGTIAMCRAIIPHMRARGSGVILNMTSSMAIAPMPFMSIYGSTKWAIEGFTETLGYELGALGIRVRLLEPGLAPTTAFASNAQGRMEGLTPPPYDVLAQGFFANMQRDYPGEMTTEEETAQATFEAAIDPGGRLRWRIGADTELLHNLRRDDGDDRFIERMRDMFVPTGTGTA